MINTDAHQVRALIQVVTIIETVQLNEIIRLTDNQTITNGKQLMSVITLRNVEIILRVELADHRVLTDESFFQALLFAIVAAVEGHLKKHCRNCWNCGSSRHYRKNFQTLRLRTAKTIIKYTV